MSHTDIDRPALLSSQQQGNFVDGRWARAESGQWFATSNPATGEVLTRLARSGEADVDLAVASARRAFTGAWRRFSPAQRQQLILRFASLFEKHFDELTLLESMDMGAPLHKRLRASKQWAIQTILYYAAQARNIEGSVIQNSLPGSVASFTLKAPVGVVGGIVPWNGPLFAQMHIIGPVLATGCTAVLKPAEDASLTIMRTAELLSEAGLPPGVVNVVTGLGSEAGAALAAHPDVDRIAFTGSTATGQAIIKASASNMKRLQLELGGKSPDVVFADADLDKAVPGVAMGVFANSGQICFAGTRIFVQRSIQDEFAEKFMAVAKSLKVGDPLDAETDLGPLISPRQLERVMDYIDIGKSEGAELRGGGARLAGDLSEGNFLEPAVFCNVHNDMQIAREEIFGPVASIIPFDTVEEAVLLANATKYGLASGVWSSNVNTVMKMVHEIEAGTVWVNCYGLVDPSVGFGGYKASGYGWKGGKAQIEGFLYQKAAYINLAAPA